MQLLLLSSQRDFHSTHGVIQGDTPSTVFSDWVDLIHFSLPTEATAWARKHGALECTLNIRKGAFFSPLRLAEQREMEPGGPGPSLATDEMPACVKEVVPTVSFLTSNLRGT